MRRGEISQQEGPEAVKELLAQAQEAQAALLEKVKELVNKALAEAKPARAADLEALEKRLAALEEEVKRLKGAKIAESCDGKSIVARRCPPLNVRQLATDHCLCVDSTRLPKVFRTTR